MLSGSVQVFSQTIWNVPAGGNIQTAIDSAAAGDTIQLAAGIYTQQVRINKNNIHLVGVGDTTIIQSPAVLSWSFTYSYTYRPIVAVDNATGVVIENLAVDGNGRGNANNRFAGIGFWRSGGTVRNVNVSHVRDNPLSGVQHGYGIISRNNTGGPYSLLVEYCTISDIQKNGIHVADNGVTATIRNNVVSGNGATGVIAQNGIVVSGNSNVDTLNNTVSGYHYTGPTWSSQGLIYMSGASGSIRNNTFTAVQGGIYALDASPVTIDGNTVTLTSNPAGVYFSAIAFGEYYSGNALTGTINNNNITGNGYTDSMGFDISTNTGSVRLTGTGNNITNFDVGVHMVEGTAGTINPIAFNHNSIAGNISFGAIADMIIDADMTNNWWGSCDGPSGAGPGSGDAVTPGILFNPFTCNGRAPVAVLNAAPRAGFTPDLQVILDGSSSYDTDGTIIDWAWNLGDGTTTSGSSLNHVYYGSGTRTVRLTVTDNDGQTGSATTRITLYDPSEILANISMNQNPLILRARGIQTITLLLTLTNLLGANITDSNFGLVFTPMSGEMLGGVSFDQTTGIYSQVLKSGPYGPDSIQVYIDGVLMASIPVIYQWPLPPVNISVQDTVDRSLFKGNFFKKIIWTHNPEQYYEISKYRIYRSLDGVTWTLAGETGGDKTEYLDGGFKTNIAYQYKITAIDTEGYESDMSE